MHGIGSTSTTYRNTDGVNVVSTGGKFCSIQQTYESWIC